MAARRAPPSDANGMYSYSSLHRSAVSIQIPPPPTGHATRGCLTYIKHAGCAKSLPGSGIEPEAFGYPSIAVTSPRDEGKDLWIQRSNQLSYPGIIDSRSHHSPQSIQLFFWRISGNTSRPDTILTRQLSRTPPKTSTFVHSKRGRIAQ